MKSSPTFTERWFAAPDLARREMLATALTAVSTGLLVNAEFESADPPEYSNIMQLQLLARR